MSNYQEVGIPQVESLLPVLSNPLDPKGCFHALNTKITIPLPQESLAPWKIRSKSLFFKVM